MKWKQTLQHPPFVHNRPAWYDFFGFIFPKMKFNVVAVTEQPILAI